MTPKESKKLADAASKRLNEFINRSTAQHKRYMREEYERERDALPDTRDLDYWLKLEK